MQPMGPRAAERLSYRMGAAIYPAILRNINLLQNAVIGPLVADIVLQQNAANGSASCREASTIVKFLRLKKLKFYNLNIS